MIIPIRCMTCSKVLANKYTYYINKIEEKKKNNKDIKEEELENFENFTTGDILDELKLTRMCCRRHMLSHVDLIDII